MTTWRSLLRPGDYLVAVAGLAFFAISIPLFWRGGLAELAVVRADGKVVSEIDLAARKTISVTGPMGVTVITVDAGRARVVSDPGPRQYCVLQGWLKRPGDIAICAPNRVSVQISGRRAAFDSLAY